MGPNTANGHTSCVMAIENATNVAFRVLRPAIEGKVSIVNVKRDAEISYMEKIQNALQRTVWSTGGSHNWYIKEVNGKRFNGMTYPWWQDHIGGVVCSPSGEILSLGAKVARRPSGRDGPSGGW